MADIPCGDNCGVISAEEKEEEGKTEEMNGKYIDRDETLFELRTGFFPQDVEYTEAIGIAESIIKSAPGVDAVEVVRCKDCVYCEKVENEIIHVWSFFCLRMRGNPLTKPDDFCSYGVRRENDVHADAEF